MIFRQRSTSWTETILETILQCMAFKTAYFLRHFFRQKEWSFTCTSHCNEGSRDLRWQTNWPDNHYGGKRRRQFWLWVQKQVTRRLNVQSHNLHLTVMDCESVSLTFVPGIRLSPQSICQNRRFPCLGRLSHDTPSSPSIDSRETEHERDTNPCLFATPKTAKETEDETRCVNVL